MAADDTIDMSDVLIYVLCGDHDTQKAAEAEYGHLPWARVVRLPCRGAEARYLEGRAYLDTLPARRSEWQTKTYVGTVSWRASQKMRVPAAVAIPEAMHKARGEGADVVALLVLPESGLMQAVGSHPLFSIVWTPVLQALGYPACMASADFPSIVGNYWAATPAWMERYCELYGRATRALDALSGQAAVALWSDARYLPETISVERRLQIWGKPYIPYHPFICERLPGFFFHHSRAVMSIYSYLQRD
jgi:hypothetical protein